MNRAEDIDRRFDGAARLSAMRGLLEAATLVNDEHDVSLALERVARAVSDSLGFQTVVINLYRRAWDDFIVSTVWGAEIIRESLLGSTYERSWWEPVLVDRFDQRGTFLIPEGSFDWTAHEGGERFVPAASSPADDGAWHSQDELFVPFYTASGDLLGIFCVGEPISGRRPSTNELDMLATLAGYAGVAVEAAQAAASAARQRRALERLLRVSSLLAGAPSADSLLGLVTDAIHEALGFEKVCVDLADETGQLMPRASTGWSAEENARRDGTWLAGFEGLLDPEFEIDGCFLVPSEAAKSRVAQTHHTYASELNGRGPHAWSNHWLLVPLYGRGGDMIGIIWADDPADRLVPNRETLQALRMFANQAMTAVTAANDVAVLRELNVTRARLLEQKRDQVAHLQALDTLKDEFVALVSHELRTPLTSIRGYAELLLEDTLIAEHRGFLEVIDRNADRLMSLVNDLLLIAEIQSGKLALETTRLRISDLIRDAADTARPLAKTKDIALEIDVAMDAETIGDRSRLGQVLDNLVANAIKFTPPGGRVHVRAHGEDGKACIVVSDTGMGIPAAEQEHLFERFFRTAGARTAAIPGTGLGLTITRGIVESHGGGIAFESEEGVGTSFRIWLPAVVGEAPESASAAKALAA